MARKAIPKTNNYPDLVYVNVMNRITINQGKGDPAEHNISLSIPEFEELISKAYYVLWEAKMWTELEEKRQEKKSPAETED